MRDWWGRECECAACNMRRLQQDEANKRFQKRIEKWLNTKEGKREIAKLKRTAKAREGK